MRLSALALAAPIALSPVGSLRAEEASSPATASAPSADLDANVPSRPYLALRATAGGGARFLYDSYVLGAAGMLGVGIDAPSGSFGLTAGVFAGKVEGGLTIVQGMVSFEADWAIGIVRLGLGPRVGYLGIDRVTSVRQFGAYTFGIAGRASIDVLRHDGIALALGVRPCAEVAAALGNDGKTQDSAAPLLGGDAFLEVRWRRAE